MTAFETVMWCGFMNEQQKVKVLWQRARNPKEGNGSNSESMDSHKLGMCNGRSRSYALCRQSTAELEDPHRVDWMCIQTLNTVLICRAAGWCLPGRAVCTSISWAPYISQPPLQWGWSLVCSRTLRDNYLPLLRLRAIVPPTSFSLLACTATSNYMFHKVQLQVEEELSDSYQDL